MRTKAEQKRLDVILVRIWAVAYTAQHYGQEDLADQLEDFAEKLQAGTLTWTDDLEAIEDE